MSITHDILGKIREIVNEYDELITRIKYYKQLIRLDPDRINELIPIIEDMWNKTEELIKIYNSNINTIYDNANNKMTDYITTLYNYLQLISIPYVIDLLTEIRDYADKRGFKEISQKLELLIQRKPQL